MKQKIDHKFYMVDTAVRRIDLLANGELNIIFGIKIPDDTDD